MFNLGSFPAFMLVAFCSISQQVNADDIQKLTDAYQLGMKLYDANEFENAERAFQVALDLAPAVYGGGDRGAVNINTATLMEFVALCKLELLQLAEAEAIFERCVEIGEREQSTPSELALRCKNNLAIISQLLYQFEKSERLFHEVLSVQTDRGEWANTANNLGDTLLSQDKLNESAKWYQASNKINRTDLSKAGQLRYGTGLHHLGIIAHRQGNAANAERLFRQGLALRQQHAPEADRFLAHSKGMLGASMTAQGRDNQARPLLEYAERAMRKYWGDDHLDVAIELHELGLLDARNNDFELAAKYFDESRRIIRNYHIRTLRSLPEHAQLRFLSAERVRFQDVLAIACENASNQRFARKTLEWVLNEKGMAHQAIADRQLIERATGTSAARDKLVSELHLVRQEMALAAAGQLSKRKLREQKLQNREAALVRQLGLASNPSTREWVLIDQVAKSLGKNSVLIEIVKLDRTEPMLSSFDSRPKLDPNNQKYLAWVLSGKTGKVQLVDLGGAIETDVLIEKFLKQIALAGAPVTPESKTRGDAAHSIRVLGDESATTEIEVTLDALATRILAPLQVGLADFQAVVICPDGNLWKVPWAALPVSGESSEKLFIEKYTPRFEISGRELVKTKLTGQKLTPPAIFASPSYDLEPGQAAVKLAAVMRKPTNDASLKTRSGGRFKNLAQLRNSVVFTPLPFAELEGRTIRDHLKTISGREPRLYIREFALEGIAKRIVRPRILSFVTHGFFLPQELSADGALHTNPLLLCGLALAGSNRQHRNMSLDDGILTGLEVVGMDLRGTEMVVLSACDTGLGKVNNGEGVAGLRQAFQLAGAQSVVATLWQVPDRDSALLMSEFFKNLADGQARPEALRNAQLARIAVRRNRFGAAHPFFWAAWTITGE